MRNTALYLWMGLVAVGAAGGVLAASGAPGQQVSSADPWCKDEDWGSDRKGVCEVREYTVPAAGATMTVDAAPNGGIKVEGGSRGDIVIRARVSAQAQTEDDARAIANRVHVTATADHVSADGPRNLGTREGWSVSYRLSVPVRTPLALKTTNGGVSIDNVDSRVEFRTVNGGVTLRRMAGDVEGQTSNGGVDVVLDGSTWNGKGLDVQTTNGGVKLSIPERYSAHLETGTVNGSVQIDFPVMVQGRIGRSFSTDLGSGGPTLRVRTSNGGVKVMKRGQ